MLVVVQLVDIIVQLFSMGVQVIVGWGELIDFILGLVCYCIKVIVVDGFISEYEVDVVLVVIGVSLWILLLVQLDGECILIWWQFYDLDVLFDYFIVVGFGVIGVEFVDVYIELGVLVMVVVSQDYVLLYEDVDVVLVLEELFVEWGVWLFKNVWVVLVICIGVGVFVMMIDGCIVEGSYVLMIIGLVFNISGLGLEWVGIQFGWGNYLIVDWVLWMLVIGIYVVGDCMGLLFLVLVVVMQGCIVMYYVLGEGVSLIWLCMVVVMVFIRFEIVVVGVL